MNRSMDKWHEDIRKGSGKAFFPMMYYPAVPFLGKNAAETLQGDDGTSMAQVMQEAVKQIPETMWAMTAMDLAVDPEAFGCEIMFREEGVPVAVSTIIEDLNRVDDIEIPDAHAGRQDLFCGAIRKAHEVITDRPVIGTMQGPFSLACTLYDLEDAMMATIQNKDNLLALIRKCTDFLKNRAAEYKKAGADGVMICEATAGVISPKQRAVFSSAFIKEIVDELQDENFHFYLHNCGRLNAKCQDIADTGIKGIQMGNWMDLGAVLDAMPEDVLVMGNIDPMDFLNEKEETIREHVMQILEIGRDHSNHIPATGCDIPYAADMNRIRWAAQIINEFH